MPCKKILQKTLLYGGLLLASLGSFLGSRPAQALEFELVEFLGVDLFNMNQSQKEFLRLGNMNLNGLLGLRPVFVVSNHVSFESSLGIGFPSVLKLLGSGDRDVVGLASFDLLHHFHYPGLYPYFLVGMGYWWHALSGDGAATSQGVTPGTTFVARFAPNLGFGLSFLSGLKIGALGSLEGFLGDRQTFHLIFELDYALL